MDSTVTVPILFGQVYDFKYLLHEDLPSFEITLDLRLQLVYLQCVSALI